MVSFQGWTADPPPVLCDLEALSYSPPHVTSLALQVRGPGRH